MMISKCASYVFPIGICILCVAFPAWAVGQDLKVKARIVAYDEFDRLDKASVPRRQLFVVRVDSLLSGDEKSKYLLVLERGFGSQSLLLTNYSAGETKQTLNLSRSASCDSSVQALGTFEIYRVPGNPEKVPRLMWSYRQDKKVGRDQVLPCYVLGDN